MGRQLKHKIAEFQRYMDMIQAEGARLPEKLYDDTGKAYIKTEGKYGEVMYYCESAQ